MVSGLVSERVCCSENRFQTFGAMETIEVTLEGLMKICGSGSGRKAVKHRRPSSRAPGLSREEGDGMGCDCCRDRGQGEKTDVARGGWAEDARRPPATSLVSVVISRLGTWGRGAAFETSRGQSGQSFEKLGRFEGERVRQNDDVQECDVALASFESSNVIAMQVHQFR